MSDVKIDEIKKNELPDLKLYFVDYGLAVKENNFDPSGLKRALFYKHPSIYFGAVNSMDFSNDIYALCMSYF